MENVLPFSTLYSRPNIYIYIYIYIYIKEKKREWENKRRNLPGLLYIISLIFFRYLGEDNSQQNYKYHKIDLEMKNWKMFDLEKKFWWCM